MTKTHIYHSAKIEGDKMKVLSKLNIIDTPCPFYDNDGVICNSVESTNPWWNKVNYVCYCPNHPLPTRRPCYPQVEVKNLWGFLKVINWWEEIFESMDVRSFEKKVKS